jgi:hypothetical protein
VRTYLGVSVRIWAVWAVLSVALGLWLAQSGLLPQPAQCGYVLEEGVWLEAGCSSVEELEERLAQIRATRSGGRVWSE